MIWKYKYLTSLALLEISCLLESKTLTSLTVIRSGYILRSCISDKLMLKHACMLQLGKISKKTLMET